MNSKKIGSNYERETARVLSKWISGKDDPLICWRLVSSGSVSTNERKKGKSGVTLDGDFQCLNPIYQFVFDTFCFDSKCYKECNPYFINEKNMKSNSILNQWIKVCKEAGSKIPVMLCKIRDRSTPEFICIPGNSWLPPNIKTMSYNFYNDVCDLKIVMLSDFISKVNVTEFYEHNKQGDSE